jgi:hypothetical protein
MRHCGDRLLELVIAFEHLLLIKVVQVQRLGKRKDVFIPIIPNQGCAYRFDRGVTTDIAQGCQQIRVSFAGNDCPDDPHACDPGDV